MKNSINKILQQSDFSEGNVIRSNIMINMIILSILLLLYITPWCDRNVPIFIKVIVSLFWLITTRSLSDSNAVTYPQKMFMWWTVYIVWLLLMSIIGHSSFLPTYYFGKIGFFIIPYVMFVVLRCYNLKEMKLLWKFFFIIVMMNLLQNYYIGIDNPDIFNFISEDKNPQIYYSSNAGKTIFVVICFFMASVFWIVNQSSKNGRMKFTMLISIMLIAIYISIINNRTTAVVLLFLEFVFFAFLKYGIKSGSSLKKVAVIFLILVFFLIVFSKEILEVAIGLFADNERLSTRLSNMYEVSDGTSIEEMDNSSLSLRFLLGMTSIQTFLSSIPNFIMGIGEDVHEEDIAGLIKYGVGCHSEFLDLAAKFGIIGIVLVYNFLINMIRFLRVFSSPGKQTMMLMVVWGIFLFYGFVNSIFYAPIFFVIFLFLPISLVLVNNKKI